MPQPVLVAAAQDGCRDEVVQRGQREEHGDRRADRHVEQPLGGRDSRAGRALREAAGHLDGEVAGQDENRDGLDGVQDRQAEVPAAQAGEALGGDAGGGVRGHRVRR